MRPHPLPGTRGPQVLPSLRRRDRITARTAGTSTLGSSLLRATLSGGLCVPTETECVLWRHIPRESRGGAGLAGASLGLRRC